MSSGQPAGGDLPDLSDTEVSNLPPGPLLVYVYLEAADEPLGYGELEARTSLPRPTLKDALAWLEDTGVVVTTPDPSDARRVLVKVEEEASSEPLVE